MYPNPQDALPFPERPNLSQYKKLAKDLLKCFDSGGQTTAVPAWARRWLEALAELQQFRDEPLRNATEIESYAGRLARFALARYEAGHQFALSDAQFVIARAHGFRNWPDFAQHVEFLGAAVSPVVKFEAAASAIVRGDATALSRLLCESPELIRAESTREHRATLLHYVAANGVEQYRQVTPKNIAAITEMLIAAGAEVDARADVYGGGCTTLGLVSTSVHPFVAGVQRDVIDTLLRHGARMNLVGCAGNKQTLVRACLANGQPDAAEYLASRGAPLDLSGAAGVGRLDIVTRLWSADGAVNAQQKEAFAMACGYGRTDVVEFLLQQGIDADLELSLQGDGHTGLHVSAYNAHVDVVDALLRRGARVDPLDKSWGTPPLVWALTGWRNNEDADRAGRYHAVVARLVRGGARVDPELLAMEEVQRDVAMLSALRAG